jgi:hypothetical protein
MFDIFDNYATDEKKEIEGIDHEIGGGATIKVARANNLNYLKAVQKASDAVAEANGLSEDDTNELDQEEYRKVLATTILMGWDKLSYKGKEIKYSVKNAMMLLKHKDFRVAVMRLASKDDGYRLAREDADEKNS